MPFFQPAPGTARKLLSLRFLDAARPNIDDLSPDGGERRSGASEESGNLQRP
jgi:hypothetical protein